MLMSSFVHLLRPKWTSLRRPRKGTTGLSSYKILFFGLIGVVFWTAIYFGSFWLCERCLAIEDIGELLLQKLLSMAFLTFFSILVFSNLVTAFSTFLLADDLQLLQSSPVTHRDFYLSRFFETLFYASWMVLVFGTPILLAYGQTFDASWRYYIQLFLVMVPFVFIPTGIAVAIALLLGAIFPARRTRELVIFLFVLGFAGLYLYIRMLQPERFADPNHFQEAIDFLGMFRDPTSPFLPSDWAVSSLFPLLSKQGQVLDSIHLIALYSTAIAIMVLSFWIFEWLHSTAFSQAQTGRKLNTHRNHIAEWVMRYTLKPFGQLSQSMLSKEIRTFLRNPGQWSQLLLLGALIVVYVFNFSSLRQLSTLKMSGLPIFIAEIGLFLFNLLLLGFVISAVAVRFAFPAVSLEGKSFWLIRQAPIHMKDFLRAKFWSVFVPLALLAEVICVLTNAFIHSSLLSTMMAAFTVLLMTAGITGMGIGMGAVFPRFEEENPAKIATGFGGVLYMILSIFWVILLILLTLVPLRHLAWNTMNNESFTLVQISHIVIVGFLAVLFTVLSYFVPMKMGAKSLEKLD